MEKGYITHLFALSRAEGLLGNRKGEVHEVDCLQRRDVAVFTGGKQIPRRNREERDEWRKGFGMVEGQGGKRAR